MIGCRDESLISLYESSPIATMFYCKKKTKTKTKSAGRPGVHLVYWVGSKDMRLSQSEREVTVERFGEWNVKVAEQYSSVFSWSYWSHLPPPLLMNSS